MCLVTVLAGVRSGLYLALACALGVVGLWAAEAFSPTPPDTALQHLLTHLLLLATAVVGAALMARTLQHALRQADEREQRFRGLLTLAADLYWEVDQDLRLGGRARRPVPRVPAPAEGPRPAPTRGSSTWA